MSAPQARTTRARKRAARPSEASDGRVRRGERSRDAIVQALFELVGAGALAPTAQQVAERAGVGLRSVFRHFRDMESLFAEVDARLLREVKPFASEPPVSGPLARRVVELAARRAQLFERIAPYKRAGNAQRAASRVLARPARGAGETAARGALALAARARAARRRRSPPRSSW